METRWNAGVVLRVALALFVLALIFGPYSLRAAVPIWIPFLTLAGLEAHFFLGALRPPPPGAPDRGPQPRDRELYGYPEPEEDELWSDGEPNAIEPAPVAPRQHRSWPRVLAGAAVVAALFAAALLVDTHTGWDGLDGGTKAKAAELFSSEASAIARKPVTVECDESRDRVGTVQHSDGAAFVGGDRAWLTPERCLDLYRLAFRDEVTGETARAIAVLAHEAWHMRGVANEGETECFAFQSGVTLGERLGLSEEHARRLMRQQLAANMLRSGRGIEYVVPAGCRDGGKLDLDPGSSVFP